MGGKNQKPDFQGLAGQQTAANRPDINTPWANLDWQQGPGGQWTMNLGLPGQVQNAFASLQGNMESAAGWDPTEQIQQAINANWDQSRSRLDPMWQQKNQAFQSQMANQGLDPGTEAFGASADTFGRQENDAYQTALRGAIGQGNETARTAIASQMLPYQQYGSLINSSMAQPHFAPAGDYAQAGMDEWNAGQAQKQGKKNAASQGGMMGMQAYGLGII